MSTWDELVDEFRSLGGTIENVQLRDGPLGRGLFVIDSSRPILIRIPDSLLVHTSQIFFENEVLRVSRDAPLDVRARQFYEDYYASLSWGGGGRAEIERLFDQAQGLPEELRQKLSGPYRCGYWFQEPTRELIHSQFIASRHISHHDQSTMMPFIELANHGHGRKYEHEDGLVLRGAAEDEVTVHYSNTDAYGLFRSWGFSCEELVAYSFELESSLESAPLRIACNPEETASTERPGYPKATLADGAVEMSFCMLGNRKFPRLCRGNFRHVLRGLGFAEVDEPFDRIRQANQMMFLSLLADIEGLEGPMVQALRRMARLQLQTLTHCYGSRELPPPRKLA